MTCDVRLNKEVQLMHKTPIILIKKDRETMYVSKIHDTENKMEDN